MQSQSGKFNISVQKYDFITLWQLKNIDSRYTLTLRIWKPNQSCIFCFLDPVCRIQMPLGSNNGWERKMPFHYSSSKKSWSLSNSVIGKVSFSTLWFNVWNAECNIDRDRCLKSAGIVSCHRKMSDFGGLQLCLLEGFLTKILFWKEEFWSQDFRL